MSEYAEGPRRAMKAKAQRLAGGKTEGQIDASGWKPEGEVEPLNNETKTGMRPVSKRAFKKGGKVHGKEAHHHAGRAKRKSGGALTAESLANTNVKSANEERPGGRDHVGGYKHGGKPKKAGGGPLGGFNAVTDPTVATAVANATQNRGGVSPQRMNFAPSGRGMLGFKKGGEVHSDEAEDRRLIDKMVKPSARTGRAKGGSMEDRPLADKGFTSYRAKGPYGHIMIGAKDHEDALKEARRSNPNIQKEALEVWNGSKYEPVHRKSGGGNWIAGAIKHPGALHKELHVPEGKKIPEKKLEKAAHAPGKEGKRARLAETLEHMHHCEGGRAERKDGGRTGKGKMNVNIIIAQPHQGGMQPPGGAPPSSPPQGGGAVPVPAPQQPGMPVMPVAAMGGMGGMGGPGAGAQMQPPPQMGRPGMPRKSGGRAYPIEDGAGGGEGRLQKIKAYGLDPEPGRSV